VTPARDRGDPGPGGGAPAPAEPAAGTLSDPDLLTGRLFFAVPVPGPSRAPLEAALPTLEPLLPGARLTAPGGWHLTLAFLGQVRAELADAVVQVGEAATAGVPAARVRLDGAGAFPSPGRARVLWAGIGGDAEVLVRLAAALAAECRAAGLRAEDRPLVPHLTLARFPASAAVPGPALDLVADAAAAGPPWNARELACFRSTVTNRGARYRVVRTFPLGG
jgi:RNA 2',3'-cyclic 3'-phosphodiesterase